MTRLDPAFLARPIAHRGLHDASRGVVENTASAVAAACARGFGIEIDIQPAADGTPMVFHDETLDRVTEAQGPIAALDPAELASVRHKGSDDGISTLAEVLELVAGRVPLLVEIKDQDGALGPDVGALQTRVAEVVAGYDGPLALMSFNPATIAALAETAPALVRGLVTCDFAPVSWREVPETRREALRGIPLAETLALDFISHAHFDLSRARVRDLKASGMPILCWTTRSLEDDRKARQIADNVTFEGYDPTGMLDA